VRHSLTLRRKVKDGFVLTKGLIFRGTQSLLYNMNGGLDRERSPLFFSSPSPNKERGIKGVRLLKINDWLWDEITRNSSRKPLLNTEGYTYNHS